MANYVSKHTGSEIDKVVDEAVLFTEQNLTEEQKNRARANLDIYSKVEVDELELITIEDIDAICEATTSVDIVDLEGGTF